MTIKADDISRIIREQIGGFQADVDVAEVGTVLSVGDAIARVQGIERVLSLATAAFDYEQAGVFQHAEVLHHRAAIQLWQQLAEHSRGHWLALQGVEHPAAPPVAKGLEQRIVPVFG